MTKDELFPGAPPDSYVDENGWLIIDADGGTAWTAAEWATTLEKPPGTRQPGRSGRPRRYFTEEARIAAKRRNDQESYRRRRYERRKDAEMRRSA